MDREDISVYQEKKKKESRCDNINIRQNGILGVLPRKHLHMCTRRHVQGCSLQYCNNEKFERTEISISREMYG